MTGKLSPEAVEKTVNALHRFRAIAQAMNVGRIDVFATEAVRQADNGQALIDAIAERTGLETRLLSGEEEAAHSALGVISGFYRPKGLIGDIGGGSLEVAEAIDDQVGERSVSLPLGTLPVLAMLEEGWAEARKRIDEMLASQLPPLLTEPTFFPVGGGWRALARVHIAMNQAPIRVVHGYELPAKEVRALAKSIARMEAGEVAALPGVPSRRIATLPAAALVLDRVLKNLKPERVIFSALGVREGWLYKQLSLEEQYLDPLVEGAQMFGTPLARVPQFGAALARWTETLFPGEAPEDKRLRLAVCALTDIGWRDHADLQATETFQRLLHFPFIGVTHAERVYLALAIHARYGGKPDDPALSPATDLLSKGLQRRAQILGRALLLGHRLSGSVPEILDNAALMITEDCVRVEVSSTEAVPDSDAVRTRLKQLAKAVGVRRTEIAKV